MLGELKRNGQVNKEKMMRITLRKLQKVNSCECQKLQKISRKTHRGIKEKHIL